jgi:hypothetical protein
MSNGAENSPRDTGHDIRLLLADVDGTLLNSARALTPSTIRVARTLRERGIALAITSSRPPRGLLQFIQDLDIVTPTGAFNGGEFVKPDLTVLSQTLISADLARETVALMGEKGLDVWVYSGDEWYVPHLDGPHVAREATTVRFKPKVAESYEPVMDRVVKIVGVTDAPGMMAAAEEAVRSRFGALVAASRSQTYYLDVTHPDANKGAVLAWLSAYMDIPAETIATIGDGHNDILMFRRSGLSIAMGNASPEVKGEAMAVTASNDEDGFARGVEVHILSKR